METKRRRRPTGKSKTEYFQDAARKYMELYNVSEFDPDDVAEWMVNTKQYEERPHSVVRRCKQELTKALRSQRITDPQGRDVRAMLCARRKNQQGELWSIWSPIYQAKPDHARRALQQWRRSIRGEVLLHERTTQSYNENNMHGAQIPLFSYDMDKDIAESKMPQEYPDEKPED